MLRLGRARVLLELGDALLRLLGVLLHIHEVDLRTHQVLLLRAEVRGAQEEAVAILLVAVVQELLGGLLREQRARVVRLDVVVQVELLHDLLRHLPVDAAVRALEPIRAAAALLDPVLDDDHVAKLVVAVRVVPAVGEVDLHQRVVRAVLDEVLVAREVAPRRRGLAPQPRYARSDDRRLSRAILAHDEVDVRVEVDLHVAVVHEVLHHDLEDHAVLSSLLHDGSRLLACRL